MSSFFAPSQCYLCSSKPAKRINNQERSKPNIIFVSLYSLSIVLLLSVCYYYKVMHAIETVQSVFFLSRMCALSLHIYVHSSAKYREYY